jgi:hypothetical protein
MQNDTFFSDGTQRIMIVDGVLIPNSRWCHGAPPTPYGDDIFIHLNYELHYPENTFEPITFVPRNIQRLCFGYDFHPPVCFSLTTVSGCCKKVSKEHYKEMLDNYENHHGELPHNLGFVWAKFNLKSDD